MAQQDWSRLPHADRQGEDGRDVGENAEVHRSETPGTDRRREG